MTHTLYPAAALARAIGGKRQGVQRELRDVRPSGVVLVSGNEANAWHFHALPARLQAELNASAQRRGYRNAEALLASPAEPMHPEFAARLRDCPLSEAIKLRDALAEPLKQTDNPNSQELTELGRLEYQRVFGYPISAKHWNRLLDRTLTRDNGAEQFHRVELYLAEAAFRRVAHRPRHQSPDHPPDSEPRHCAEIRPAICLCERRAAALANGGAKHRGVVQRGRAGFAYREQH